MDLNTILFALGGGVLPSIAWLWFWLREDRKHPEPTYAIVKAFIAGGLAVFVSVFLEKITKSRIESILSMPAASVAVIASWAAIEEATKFTLAYFSSLKNKYNDEPIDSMIYMITVALGFAAVENTMFLLNPLIQNKLFESLLTGNLRFLGATLLHVLASSVVGAGLALSFNKSKKVKTFAGVLALIFAIVAHFAFNYSISELNIDLMRVFAFVWVGLVALLILFEKVKRIKF